MWTNKVVWAEGMFLQPQHFQQQERYFERMLEGRVAPVAQYGWGFATLDLDESLLGMGRVSLARARGVFPDGTPFAVPGTDSPPLPLEIPTDARGEAVVLALPLRRPGAEECDLANSDEAGLTRYAVAETDATDVNTGSNLRGAPLQVGRLRMRLMLGRDAVDAYATLGVARITERRPDNRVELDADYIPPLLDALSHPRLAGWIRDLEGRLHHRGEMLARDFGQPGERAVSEVSHFLLLQVVNRFEPLFSHFARSSLTHPVRLYEACLLLAGELATFTHESRRPLSFPDYQHDALERCFAPLIQDLQISLGWAPEERAIRIDLEVRPFNLRLALIRDAELLRSATLVVAAKAQIPSDEMQQTFPRQVKLGPADRIRDLVNLNLPGLGIRLLPVAPRQIPYHADFHYFTIERSGELWKQLEASRALALHVAGEFPGLELECWAIRE
jgi:type VI secretion system protein ImpJ